MKNNEVKQQKKINHIYFDKNLFILLLVCFVFSSITLQANGWLNFSLGQTNDLPKYLSEKLSRPGKYTIKFGSIENSFPTITGKNITYNSLRKVSSLSFNIKELIVNPDYSNLEVGTHSFKISGGNLFLRRRKFVLNSNDIAVDGLYRQKQVYIASSTWKLFGGRAYITGHVDTKAKPSRYNLCAELYSVRLDKILSNTKNKGSFTGDVFGMINLNNYSENPSFLLGNAYLYVYNGTYNKPELVDKINNAFHKLGLQSKLKDLAVTIASSPFIFKGEFLINGNMYLTENAFFKTPWGTVKFFGRIGPKSAIDGVLVVYFKNYASFTVKINGSNSKNMNYRISENDKARLVTILLREASKETEKQIKKDGRRTNRKINNGIKNLGNETRKLFKNL